MTRRMPVTVSSMAGTRCLDISTQLMLVAEHEHGVSLAWAREKLINIEATIADLEEKLRYKDASNWRAFQDRFSAKVRTWPGGASTSSPQAQKLG